MQEEKESKGAKSEVGRSRKNWWRRWTRVEFVRRVERREGIGAGGVEGGARGVETKSFVESEEESSKDLEQSEVTEESEVGVG